MPASTESTNSHHVGWQFDNTYGRLPEVFYVKAEPAQARSPAVVMINHPLADTLGLNLRQMPESEAAALFAGQLLPAGSEPIAQAYAGHQFGSFTMLGDGRAILLGEHRTPIGELVDIQFKGSGPTAFSRGGDGLAALGPMLREYVISYAMHALGIPTTRSLAVVTTGREVWREARLPGSILTRVAASHLRVGTFQYAAALRDEDHLRTLADYAIDRHYPDLAPRTDKYVALLRAVMERQAALVAQWQCVGFVHGVMNTDNMTISGETIDYGPCAFMDAYHAGTVFSSIDHGGRYAYGNQPSIAQWNVARFAETLLKLIDSDQDKAIAQATAVILEYPALFKRLWLAGMRKKLGLTNEETQDEQLVESLLGLMQAAQADYTNTFRELSAATLPKTEFFSSAAFQAWHTQWEARRDRDGSPRTASTAVMKSVNPQVIPRNHRVEEALAAASDAGDFTPLHRLLAALESPYEDAPAYSDFRDPPPADFGRYRTFCGT